jgi:hypothetical protein
LGIKRYTLGGFFGNQPRFKKEETMGSFMRNVGVAILSLLLVAATGLAQDKFFDSNGVPIRYVEQGSGDVIVLLHGNGNTLNAWINAGVLPNWSRITESSPLTPAAMARAESHTK